jgi:hypothetical protein
LLVQVIRTLPSTVTVRAGKDAASSRTRERGNVAAGAIAAPNYSTRAVGAALVAVSDFTGAVASPD